MTMSRWVWDTASHVRTDPGSRGCRGMACRAQNTNAVPIDSKSIGFNPKTDR